MISLDFAVANHDLLKKAAEALGMKFISKGVIQTKNGSFIRFDGDTAVCNDYDKENVQELRRQYAREAVKTVAQKLGWRREVKGSNKMRIAKGY